MSLFKCTALIVAFSLPCLAFGGSESVNITSPTDGAKIQVSGTQLVYDAAPGPNGDYAVVTVDGTEAAVLSELKGKYMLDKLSLGDHTVCVKVVDKGRAPTGAEKCIRVTAANPGLWTY
jgi:hypothetical protein